jgi:hypothetical protein
MPKGLMSILPNGWSTQAFRLSKHFEDRLRERYACLTHESADDLLKEITTLIGLRVADTVARESLEVRSHIP